MISSLCCCCCASKLFVKRYSGFQIFSCDINSFTDTEGHFVVDCSLFNDSWGVLKTPFFRGIIPAFDFYDEKEYKAGVIDYSCYPEYPFNFDRPDPIYSPDDYISFMDFNKKKFSKYNYNVKFYFSYYSENDAEVSKTRISYDEFLTYFGDSLYTYIKNRCIEILNSGKETFLRFNCYFSVGYLEDLPDFTYSSFENKRNYFISSLNNNDLFKFDIDSNTYMLATREDIDAYF